MSEKFDAVAYKYNSRDEAFRLVKRVPVEECRTRGALEFGIRRRACTQPLDGWFFMPNIYGSSALFETDFEWSGYASNELRLNGVPDGEARKIDGNYRDFQILVGKIKPEALLRIQPQATYDREEEKGRLAHKNRNEDDENLLVIQAWYLRAAQAEKDYYCAKLRLAGMVDPEALDLDKLANTAAIIAPSPSLIPLAAYVRQSCGEMPTEAPKQKLQALPDAVRNDPHLYFDQVLAAMPIQSLNSTRK